LGQNWPIVEQLRPPVAMPTKTFVVTGEGPDEFARAIDGAAAALERHERAPLERIAVHTGTSARRAEQLRAVANRGQVLLSSLSALHIVSEPSATFELRDLGIHRLRDLSAPERVYELRPPTSRRRAIAGAMECGGSSSKRSATRGPSPTSSPPASAC
jgi:hypothetical protein